MATARVTEVLAEIRQGTPGAEEELLRLVYAELRRVARGHMRRQPAGHTLQTTALVHEAYLKLVGGGRMEWNDRTHFLRAAARSMRTILVDFARRRSAQKRGADAVRITLHEVADRTPETTHDVVAVHEALAKLEGIDPQMSEVVELRFFGGLTMQETARTLGLGERTAYKIWEHARTWLFREIKA